MSSEHVSNDLFVTINPGHDYDKYGDLQPLSSEAKRTVAANVKALLHASRDCMRNQDKDTIRTAWNINDGYYGEAFGIMRSLVMFGNGYFGASNMDAVEERRLDDPHLNVKWWFSQLEKQVLAEEGFNGDHRCDYCRTKYYKDDNYLIERGELTPDY